MRRLSTILLTGALLYSASASLFAGDSPRVPEPQMNLTETQYKVKIGAKKEDGLVRVPLYGTMGPEGIDMKILKLKRLLSGELSPGYHELYVNIPFEAEDSLVKAYIEADGSIPNFEICEARKEKKEIIPGPCFIGGSGSLVPYLQLDFSYYDDSTAGEAYQLTLAPSEEGVLSGGVTRFDNLGTEQETQKQTVSFKGWYKQKHK